MKKSILLLIPVVLFSCNFDKNKVDRSQFEEEISNREIKRVTDVQILEQAYKQGDVISKNSQKAIGEKLKMAIQQGGFDSAIGFCNASVHGIVDSLKTNYNADIRRTSLKLRNPSNAPNDKEKQLLEAYQYSFDKKSPIKGGTQVLENGDILYTKPIFMKGLCLNCHGKPGGTLNQDAYTRIQELYPSDSALHYVDGDLRGMWSIRLSKKTLIKSL